MGSRIGALAVDEAVPGGLMVEVLVVVLVVVMVVNWRLQR